MFLQFSTKMKICMLILAIALSFDFLNAAEEKSDKKGKTWAVLMCAIRYYWSGYGCEAAVYRAYHLLIDGGVPADNIIVLAADNAPWNLMNPLPGVVVHGEECIHNYTKEYYLDVNIDYTNADYLNATQFFSLFSGNSALLKGFGSERVIKSGPDDNILFYHIGYASYGYFLFNSYYIDTEEFIPMLEKMKEDKRFNKFLYIADTGKSGSFFDDYLDNNKNIYALTNTGRYLWFDLCHWNNQVHAYTSTCFSYGVLNYIEYLVKTKKIGKESIFDLFYGIRTTTSVFAQTNIYGDLRTAGTKITDFFGDFKPQPSNATVEKIELPKKMGPSSCSSISHLQKQLEASLKTSDPHVQQEIQKNIDSISSVVSSTSKTVDDIVEKVFNGTGYNVAEVYQTHYQLNKEHLKCIKTTRNAAFDNCFPKENTMVVVEYMNVFEKMCSMNINESKIVRAMEAVCNKENQPILLQ